MKFDVQLFFDDCHDIIHELRLQGAEPVRVEVSTLLWKRVLSGGTGRTVVDGVPIVQVDGLSRGFAYTVVTEQ